MVERHTAATEWLRELSCSRGTEESVAWRFQAARKNSRGLSLVREATVCSGGIIDQPLYGWHVPSPREPGETASRHVR